MRKPTPVLEGGILFKGHGRAGELPRVRKLHAAMVKRSIAFDVPTCNALLGAYARYGDLDAAERTMAQMRWRSASSRSVVMPMSIHSQSRSVAYWPATVLV